MIAKSSYLASLQVTAQLNANSNKIAEPNKTFVDTANITVMDSADDEYELAAGFVPLLHTDIESTGQIVIHNYGSIDTPILSIDSSADKVQVDSDTCTDDDLAPGQDCIINFSIDTSETDGVNSDSVKVQYGAGKKKKTMNIPVEWINSTHEYPYATIDISEAPIEMTKDNTKEAIVTITNEGGYDLQLQPAVVNKLTGSATIVIKNDGNTCDSSTLAIGAQCHYTISISDPVSELNQSLMLYLNTSYTDNNGANISYDIARKIEYNSRENAGILFIDPKVVSMEIINDNIDNASTSVLVKNIGGLQIKNVVGSLNDANPPNYFTVDDSSCKNTNTLDIDEGCTILFKLTANNHSVESKVFTYTITGEDTNGSMLSESVTINTSIITSKISLSVIADGSGSSAGRPSGDGTELNQFLFNGNNSEAKSIKLIYTNQSMLPITIKGFDYKEIKQNIYDINAASTCVSDVKLENGDSCSLIYNIIFGSSGANIGSSAKTIANINVPTLYVIENAGGSAETKVQETPLYNNAAIIYAAINQQIITNSVDFKLAESSIMITNSIDAFNPNNDVKIDSQFTNYVQKGNTQQGNCEVDKGSLDSPEIKQTCSLSQTSMSQSMTYLIDSDYITSNPLDLVVKFQPQISGEEFYDYNDYISVKIAK